MMKPTVQVLTLGLFSLFALSLTAQQPSAKTYFERHQIDDYCGSDHSAERAVRAPDGVPVQRYTGCAANMSLCYSSCTPTVPGCKYRVPIVFTIITDGSGNTTLGSTEGEVIAHVSAALARCNNYYADAGIEFVQCESPRNADGTDTNFDSADFYDFDSQSSGDNDDAEIKVYDETNVINVYLAPEVASSGTAVCGYAKFPGLFTNGVSYDQNLRSVIKNSCLTGDNTTLEHELGHFSDWNIRTMELPVMYPMKHPMARTLAIILFGMDRVIAIPQQLPKLEMALQILRPILISVAEWLAVLVPIREVIRHMPANLYCWTTS